MNLKRISPDAIPAALARAERYRLLNQARQAESIARDILAVVPDHQEASVLLLLALTDCFTDDAADAAHVDALALVPKLDGDYARAYYEGLVVERWALALQHRAAPHHLIADWIEQAMVFFEMAEARRQPGNDEALLRWNACARLLARLLRTKKPVVGADQHGADMDLGDDPPR
ncbi:MAG: hypothetical protein SGI90_12880 [Candidatus Eisenbacteria bacterium]|nr:hypothetical protein [Candidatus Eisenbacteria bacterium]